MKNAADLARTALEDISLWDDKRRCRQTCHQGWRNAPELSLRCIPATNCECIGTMSGYSGRRSLKRLVGGIEDPRFPSVSELELALKSASIFLKSRNRFRISTNWTPSVTASSSLRLETRVLLPDLDGVDTEVRSASPCRKRGLPKRRLPVGRFEVRRIVESER